MNSSTLLYQGVKTPKKIGAVEWTEVVAERRWSRYASHLEELMVDRVVADIKRTTGELGRFLDYGSSTGPFTTFLADRGHKDAVCIDISPEAIQICRKNNPNAVCQVITTADRELPLLENNSVSLILCFQVPGVLESSWFQSEINRILKPGGYVIGMMHNKASWRGWRQRNTVFEDEDRFYVTSFREWQKQVRVTAGLEIVEAEGLCWWPFHRTSNSPLIPFFAWLEKVSGLRKWISHSPWVLFTAKKV